MNANGKGLNALSSLLCRATYIPNRALKTLEARWDPKLLTRWRTPDPDNFYNNYFKIFQISLELRYQRGFRSFRMIRNVDRLRKGDARVKTETPFTAPFSLSFNTLMSANVTSLCLRFTLTRSSCAPHRCKGVFHRRLNPTRG